jgi:hypothetical protein
VRTIMIAGACGLALAAAACGGDASSANDDLTRDLQLAASANLNLASQQAASYSLTETAPKAEEAPRRVVRRDPGSRAIPDPSPTVSAELDPELVAATMDVPQVQSVATASAPAVEMEPVPAIVRPVPQSVDRGPSASGNDDHGGGIGQVLGGIFGGGRVVIRGGGVGEDRCELHDMRPGGRTSARPVFVPNPSGPIAVNNRAPQRSTGGGTSIARRRP